MPPLAGVSFVGFPVHSDILKFCQCLSGDRFSKVKRAIQQVSCPPTLSTYCFQHKTIVSFCSPQDVLNNFENLGRCICSSQLGILEKQILLPKNFLRTAQWKRIIVWTITIICSIQCNIEALKLKLSSDSACATQPLETIDFLLSILYPLLGTIVKAVSKNLAVQPRSETLYFGLAKISACLPRPLGTMIVYKQYYALHQWLQLELHQMSTYEPWPQGRIAWAPSYFSLCSQALGHQNSASLMILLLHPCFRALQFAQPQKYALDE